MENKEKTKNKIIEAAYKCFSTKGYITTPTKEIAEVAGVSEITIFRHFGTKENLLEVVLKRYSILPDLKKVLQKTKGNLKEILEIFGKNFFLALRKKKNFIKITFSEFNKYPEKIIDIYKSIIKEIDQFLINLLNLNKNVSFKRDVNIDLAVSGFRGMIFSYFQLNEIFLNKELSELEIETAIKNFVEIFLFGVIDKFSEDLFHEEKY